MLRERISLRDICSAVSIRLAWLLRCIVVRFAAYPDDLPVRLPQRPTDVVVRRLEAEADEMWNYVQQKANKPWIWIAIDAPARLVMAFHLDDRSRDSAQELWAEIPLIYREQTMFHADQFDAYTGVIPVDRHKAIPPKARKTNYIERFNAMLRQRVSRLVRETLPFSKKLAHHIGAIKYFIGHNNLTRAAAALPV